MSDHLSTYHEGESAERPWGSWRVFGVYPRSILKQIVVEPGGRLSLQRHQHRIEHWIVAQGHATVELDGKICCVSEGEAVNLPRGCSHRLSNETDELLVVIELQQGDILSEDDIERFDDDYNRTLST